MSGSVSGEGEITAVCVTRALQPRTTSTRTLSGIDKAPVELVVVTALGVEGDQVRDTVHHGGVDKAAYAYADEDAAWWETELEDEIPPGRFGENLRTSGIDLSGAVIGERWQVGDDVLLEVSAPRVPCATFQHHMDDRSGWVRRFTNAGRVGTYLRVLEEGEITPGDPVTVVDRPRHGVTVGRWFSHNDPDDARALLAAETTDWQLATSLKAQAEHVISRR